MKRAKRNCNCRGICSKILLDINNGRRKSSDNVFSHCLRCFPARDKRNHLSKYIHTRARAMVKRKKMRGSIVVARADRIYRSLFDCAQPAVGNCHSRQRTRRPFIVPMNYSDRNLFLSDKISDRMRFSPFLEIARNVDHRRVPSSHFTKLSSVVRNVR